MDLFMDEIPRSDTDDGWIARRRGKSMRGDRPRRRAARIRHQAVQVTSTAQVAGGLGFEPRLAESESAVLPLDDPPNPLPLGVLRAPARLATSNFLALDLARVARDEARRT